MSALLPAPVLHAVPLSQRADDGGGDGLRGLRRESTVRTMEEALEEAEKHADRYEALAALMAVARRRLEQARATMAE